MGAGNLDRRVQFRRYTESDDGYGVKKTWADHGSAVWASKKDVSDGERMAAGWVEASVVSRFVVRWSTFTAAIDPRDRLKCEGLEMEIIGIKEGDGRHRWIEITAQAAVDTATRTAP